MKKLFIFLPIMLAATLVFPNNSSFFKTEKSVNKQINLAVFTSNNYTSAAYNDAQATIEITITKVRGTSKKLICKKQFGAMQLRTLPAAGNALQSDISIPNVLDSKETIVVSYAIIYNSKGSIVKFENNEVLAKGANKDKLSINI